MSFPVLALQDMSDDALSATDAQAGLTLSFINMNTSGVGFGYQDTDGVAAYGSSTGYSGAGNLDLDGWKLTTTGIATLKIDAGANSGGTAAAANFTFNTPSSTVSLVGTTLASLGMNVLVDACSGTAGTLTQCTPGNANDAAILVMPSSNASLSVTATGLTLNLQGGTTPQGHMGVLTDTSAMSFTLGNTGANAVGLALADYNHVVQATSVVGGVGFQSMTLTGVDLGQTSGTDFTSLDVCTGSGGSALCTSLGKGGLALTFNGAAMTGIGVTINNVTAGNIGAGATVAGTTYVAAGAPNYGSYTISGLSLAGASLMISGH